jgi:hypothetical protein
MDTTDASGATINCKECGKAAYFLDARGRCAECSSVCHYCSKTQGDSGMPVEVIDHKSGMLMAHRTCHAEKYGL